MNAENFSKSTDTLTLFNAVLQNSDLSIVLIDKNLKVLCFSDKTKKSLFEHFSKNIKVGDDYRQYVRESLLDKFLNFFDRALQGETLETEMQSIGDLKIWFRYKISPVYDSQKNIFGVSFTITEIQERKKAEYETKKKSSELNAFFESIEGSACVIDTDKKYVIFNKQFIKEHFEIANIKPEIGGEAYDFLSKKEKADRYKILDQVLSGNKQIIDAQYVRDNRIFYYRNVYSPIFTNEKITGISVYSVDMTDTKETQSALQESEQKFRNLVENTTIGVYIIQDGKFTYVNPRFAEIFEYDQQEMIDSVPALATVSDEDVERVAEKMKDRIEGRLDFIHYEVNGLTKTGRRIWTDVYGSTTLYNGKPAIIGTLQDITEKKKTEEILKKQEEEITAQAETYEAIIENTKEGIYLISPDFKLLRFNKTFKERFQILYGHEPEIGIDFRNYLEQGPIQKELFHNLFNEAIEQNQKNDCEVKSKSIEGNSFWFRIRTSPVYDKHDQLLGVSFTSKNITERKKSEQEILRLSRLYYLTSQINETILKVNTKAEIYSEACRIAIETGGFEMAWIGIYDEKEDIIEPTAWTKGSEDFFQNIDLKNIKISSAEIPLAKIIKSKTPMFLNDIKNELSIPDNIKTELLKKNYLSFVGLPIIIDSKVIGVFAMFMPQTFFFNDEEVKLLNNVTENIAFALDKIRIGELHTKTEANLTSVFDNTDVGFLLLDKHFNIINFNSTYHESYQKLFGSKLHQNANYVSLASPERRSDLKKNLNKVLTENQPWKYELQHQNNNQIYYYYNSIIPVHNFKNEVIGFCISSNEITERKLLEIKQEKMLKDLSQRNRDLEKFSYIVSHNLRAPISRILGLNDLLKVSQNEEDKTFAIESLNTSVKDLDAVIKDMNEILYIRNEIAELKTDVNLESIVKEVKSSLALSINRKQAVIECDFSAVNELYGLKSYVYNIFFHLISNGIKFSRPDLTPHLWISTQKVGNKTILRFLDNGTGIDLHKYGTQVFGLYKRFHLDVEGKGMGLYMVKTQVEIMGGTIEIISSPNEGSEFVLTFEQE